MREPLAMEKGKRGQDRFEHGARFGGRERALRKDLREVFFLVFHDDVEHVGVLKNAAAGVKNGNKVRMRKLRGAAPKSKLELRGGRVRGHELYDSFLRILVAVLGEEGGGVVRAAQVFAQ